MTKIEIPIIKNILNANDQIANSNRKVFDDHGIFSINIMASPGSGKTSLILRMIEKLRERLRIAVIEGDTAPVTIDADKIAEVDIPAVQINTGGDCHLDALMIQNSLPALPLDDLDLAIVENVGNLICPAAFRLGTHINVLIAATTEGDDKPYKYPNIYRDLDALILNKLDLLPHLRFNQKYFQEGVTILNPSVAFFPVSCETGENIVQWTEWLYDKVNQYKKLLGT